MSKNMESVSILRHVPIGKVCSDRHDDKFYDLDWYLVCPKDKDENDPKNHRRWWRCSCESAVFRGKKNQQKQNKLMKDVGQTPPRESGSLHCKHLHRLYMAKEEGYIPSGYQITEEGLKILKVKDGQVKPIEDVMAAIARDQEIAEQLKKEEIQLPLPPLNSMDEWEQIAFAIGSKEDEFDIIARSLFASK